MISRDTAKRIAEMHDEIDKARTLSAAAIEIEATAKVIVLTSGHIYELFVNPETVAFAVGGHIKIKMAELGRLSAQAVEEARS